MDYQKELILFLDFYAPLKDQKDIRDAVELDKSFPCEINMPRLLAVKCLSENYAFRLKDAWKAWRAAKAQAVPEGFVLIKSSDRDREICELIDQRDLMEMLADQLKDKLQDLYKVDFGEYTSCNCPLRNAIEYNDSDLVLVPKIPTRKMIDAGDKQIIAECVYKAMIEAQEQKG